MMIIGCDFHPSWQQIAWLDSETGETGEQKLVHGSGDAKTLNLTNSHINNYNPLSAGISQ